MFLFFPDEIAAVSFAFPEQTLAVMNSVLVVSANFGGNSSTREFQQVKKNSYALVKTLAKCIF